MKKLRRFLSRIRLVYRRSSTLLKCVVLTTIVLCTIAIITITAATKHEQRKKEAARQQGVLEQQKNDELKEDIANLGTVESIRKIAFEILGLVDPDTLIIETE